MYDGVPSIRLEGDQQRALALVPEAKALLYRCQELIKNAGVSTFSMSQSVEDGYIYVLCAGDQNIISISVGVEEVDETYEESEYPYSVAPDFYSGIVASMAMRYVKATKNDGSKIDVPVCPSFSPTPDCIESHPNDKLVQGRQQVSRLGVEPHVFLSELKNETGLSGGVKFHQYGKLRSSMYSGTMRKVAQIVMGLGKMSAAKFRDPFAPSDQPDSAYVKSVIGPGVQMRYDYKYNRTHGIHIADDGEPWLVEISSFRGVLAMRLPVFPRSTSKGFKEAARDRKDDAMVRALDELGYLPTGESFPFGQNEIDAAIKAGTILQLLPASAMSPAYDFSGYSSACGWAFSPDGREAHNTGRKIGDDNIQTGAWFQLNIQIGALKPRRAPREPIANGSATLVKVKEGRLFCSPAGPPGTRSHYLPFKVYEPMLEGLVSIEGVPGEPIDNPPISDTPVFVCFVGNALKVVNYYHNPEYLNRDHTTMEKEFGRCLLAGKWELVQGEKYLLPRMMYTNDYDYRREIQIGYSKETLESVDLGFKPGAAYFFAGYSDHWATGARYKGFSNKHAYTEGISERIAGVVIVPRYSREAFYFATADWEGKYVSEDPNADPTPDPIETMHRDWQFNMRDPNIYSMFVCGTYGETNFFAIPNYIVDSVPDRLRCRGGATCPFVSWGDAWQPPNPRVINHYYAPESECAEQYADEGPWLESCQQLPQPQNGYVNQWPTFEKRYNTVYPYRQSSALFLVTQGHNGPIQIDTSVDRVMSWWDMVSPDIYGNYQQITATHSAIGEECVIYDTAPHDDPTRIQKITGYVPDAVPPVVYPTFVGVNIA